MEVKYTTREQASDLYRNSLGPSEEEILRINTELAKGIVNTELLVPFLEITLQIIRARLRTDEDRYSYPLRELEVAIIYFANKFAEFQKLSKNLPYATKVFYQSCMETEFKEITDKLALHLPGVFKNEF